MKIPVTLSQTTADSWMELKSLLNSTLITTCTHLSGSSSIMQQNVDVVAYFESYCSSTPVCKTQVRIGSGIGAKDN